MPFEPGAGPPIPGRSRRSTVTGEPAAAETVTPLGDAVDDTSRDPLVSLVVDWDRTGTHPLQDVSGVVAEVSIERTATGDLPDEVGLIEGPVSAELTATLGGEDHEQFADGTTAFSQLAPYREDSQLHLVPVLGAPVTCSLGLTTDTGPQMVTQFTGQVRSLRTDSASRQVALAALDPADLLHAKITLPALAMAAIEALGSGHQFMIRPQAVIDHVLRRNGIYASPPVHDNCQISCTGHGWLGAEHGRNAVPRGVAPLTGDPAWWVDDPDHPFGMLAVRGLWDTSEAFQEFFAATPYTPTAGNGIGIAAWVHVGNDMALAGNRTIFQFSPLVTPDAVTIELNITGGGVLGGYISVSGVYAGVTAAITTPAAWMYLGIHFQHLADGTTTVRLRRNGTTTSGSITSPALSSTVAPNPMCTAWTSARDWSNFQLWYDPDPPPGDWPGEIHTPQATIGVGANLLTHLPEVVQADSWDVIKDVAAAEYALVGFDPTGAFFFRPRDTYDPSTVEKEITSDRSLMDLATQVTTDNVRNVVTIETVPAFLRWPTVLAEARDVTEWQSTPGVTTHNVPLAHGAIAHTTMTIPRVDSANWSTDTTWGYVSVRADSPATEITSGVTVVFSGSADRMAQLTVYNYTEYTVRFATTSGSPALRAVGWGLVEEPAELDEVRAEGSVAQYGERVLPIDASPWRQLTAPLLDVAGGLLAVTAQPVPVIEGVQAVGDPGLGLGDTVRLVDPDGAGSMRATVVKINRTFSGGLVDALAVRPVHPPGLGIADDLELGLADSTLIAAP